MAPALRLPDFGSLLGIGLFCFISSTVLYIIDALFFRIGNPRGVPLIREPLGKTRFSLKTRLVYFTNCESLFREAYQNVHFAQQLAI